MSAVHARFRGKAGYVAQLGDSITHSLAFWAPLGWMSAVSGILAYAASLCGKHEEAVAAAERASHLSDRNPLELVVLISALWVDR
jgi:hypothetical protein